MKVTSSRLETDRKLPGVELRQPTGFTFSKSLFTLTLQEGATLWGFQQGFKLRRHLSFPPLNLWLHAARTVFHHPSVLTATVTSGLRVTALWSRCGCATATRNSIFIFSGILPIIDNILRPSAVLVKVRIVVARCGFQGIDCCWLILVETTYLRETDLIYLKLKHLNKNNPKTVRILGLKY